VRLARWAGPGTRVGAGGELVDEELPAAAEALGLDLGELGDDLEEGDGEAYASEAWRVAVDTGLVAVEDADASGGEALSEGASEGPSAGSSGSSVGPSGSSGSSGSSEGDETGRVSPGAQLALITSGAPQDILPLWLEALDVVFADATAPILDDLAAVIDDDGEIDFDALDWDPEAEAEFLEGVLGNLYLLTVADGGATEGAVPLPVLAASMIVPDDMGEPTDDILEQVSEAMMRLDDQFQLLEPIGLVTYTPVDEALMVEDAEGAESALPIDEDDVSRYGLVRLTPLGLYGIRSRMLEAGVDAPAVGDLADKDARALLDGIAHFPELSARAETEQW
ncbi:hypothetical protein GT042_02130, partial [Streptomyces sp. SID3212]|nr:hypothetical protein [Streptomyces sp. SID3212]